MSHHKEGEKKKAAAPKPEKIAKRSASDQPSQDGDEQDVEGHNLLAMTDYYVQAKMGRQADIEREARKRAQVKEAKQDKPTRR